MSAIPPESLPPVEPAHLLDSRLFVAAARSAAAPTVQPQGDAEPAATAQSLQGPVSTAGGHFEMSVGQINELFRKFNMVNMKYEDLMALPMSLLTWEEREFVLYLQRNQNIFQWISRLDREPGLSMQDVHMAAQLAGDALVLNDQDLKYLQSVREPEPDIKSASPQPTPIHYQPEQISQVLQKIDPRGVTPEQLMALSPNPPNLTAQERAVLDFLKSRPVQAMLPNVVKPFNGILTLDALRVLISLIWNPAIYGAVPVVFMHQPLFEDEEEPEPIDSLASVEREGKHPGVRQPRLHVQISARLIAAICKKLSPDGHVTLEQLRRYTPVTIDEARVVNTLKQAKIFQALAAQDDEPDTLSMDDIKLAMTEEGHALLLFDPYIVLVIMP